MKRFLPNMYKKSIFDINYNLLKKNNIKCLIFDLDNTIALIDEKITPKKTMELFDRLKKDFTIYIISNNYKNRVEPYSNQLKVKFVSFAMKPFTKGLKEVKKLTNFKKEEMCMIGDQLMTDILSGNNYNIYTILVDPLGVKDLKITKVNRAFENVVLKKLKKQNKFNKGVYYE